MYQHHPILSSYQNCWRYTLPHYRLLLMLLHSIKSVLSHLKIKSDCLNPEYRSLQEYWITYPNWYWILPEIKEMSQEREHKACWNTCWGLGAISYNFLSQQVTQCIHLTRVLGSTYSAWYSVAPEQPCHLNWCANGKNCVLHNSEKLELWSQNA